MLKIYKSVMSTAAPALDFILNKRLQGGKEDAVRIAERKGVPGKNRPQNPLIWLHAASVGEAQSALIMIESLLKKNDTLGILVTTGTLTSAAMMEKNLPARAFHQFYPLDHPAWVKTFLDHWRPDLVLWMESELWPNMLLEIKTRNIPAALINARLSEKSYKRWKLLGGAAEKLLDTFSLILAQTEEDEKSYRALKARTVITTGNLKYSASALPYDQKALDDLSAMTTNRPLWLYASTHDGEEDMACRIHQILKNTMPDLLTVLVPRHPERREDILNTCNAHSLAARLRGQNHELPHNDDDIYIADTLGELGIFYRLAPVTCIGRSFSRDGGGGHNPIEAAQLNCAILSGPNVQYQRKIFDEMQNAQAVTIVKDEIKFTEALRNLLNDPSARQKLQTNALNFSKQKSHVIDTVMQNLEPLLEQSGICTESERACA